MKVSMKRTSAYLALVIALGFLANGCLVVGPPYPAHARYTVEATVPVVPAPAPVVVAPAAVEAPDVTVYIDDAHPGAVHDYYFYPSASVYFDPITVSWFWNDGGHWRHGRSLPPRFHVDEHERRHFRSDAHEPYAVHDRVRSRISAAPAAPRGVPAPSHVAPSAAPSRRSATQAPSRDPRVSVAPQDPSMSPRPRY